MLRDLRVFERDSGKNHPEGNENLPVNQTDSLPISTVLNPARPPLNMIQESTQNHKSAPQHQSGFHSKFAKTPSRNMGKISDVPVSLRTPEKAAVASTASILQARRKLRLGGQKSEFYSSGVESGSIQSPPVRSASKLRNPAFTHLNGSRIPFDIGTRNRNCSLMSKGISSCCAPTTCNTVEIPYFELIEDPLFWMDHNVQVLIRVRPLNSRERSLQGYNRCLKQDSAQTITWLGQPDIGFKFDHVACETVNQEMLFRAAGLPLVENCMSGYNSCMFAYGQTGSGKTYTMLGEIDELELRSSLDRGMTPRIFEFLFARIRAEEESRGDEKLKYNCKCSFLEIYNEQITDLLDPSSTNLALREDVKKGVYVENLTEFKVESMNDILKFLIQGTRNRKVAATNMNRDSSRSHSVFTCVIESQWEKDSRTNRRYARLNLVDLAGSERQKASGAEGERLKEATNINKSLSTLGHVIMALVDLAQGKQRHVPYRDSRLTFLLQDSLGGNSKTMIIANVSPSICCAAETLSTLKFAQRAKFIQNNAIVNEDASGNVILLHQEINLLKEELSLLKRQNDSEFQSFCSEVPGDSKSEASEPAIEEKLPIVAYENIDDSYESETFGIVKVSIKQLRSLQTILAGTLRREQMADATVKQLQAEIEHLNLLVQQKEEEARCTKMKLRFREDRIQRMQSLVDGLLPPNSYLTEQNNVLAEEIQLLQSQVDSNPEVTRFALENNRLLNQLKRFQEFYENGEREKFLSEVSELRDQLCEFLNRKSKQDKHVMSCTALEEISQFELAKSEEKNSSDKELEKIREEFDNCRNNLNSCSELNAKLTRERDDLTNQLHNQKSAFGTYVEHQARHNLQEPYTALSFTQAQTNSFGAVQESVATWKHKTRTKHDEEIINLQLDLDILKTILAEERSSRARVEDRVLCLNKDLAVAKDELKDAKSVIEALEFQQILSINELEELRNANKQYVSLLRRWDPASKLLQNVDSPSRAELKRMQASFQNARRLKARYQSDQLYQTSHEQEMNEVCTQVEAETAEVIVCLQDELAKLQQQVGESNRRELEIEMENRQLCELLEERDEELRLLTEEWDMLASEITEILADGQMTMEKALNEVEFVEDSSPERRTWVGEQFVRMMRIITEKEFFIEELQKRLDDAHKFRYDIEWKLMSLRGATLAITEAQQQENRKREKAVVQLTSELTEHKSLIDELKGRIRHGEDQFRKAEIRAAVAFIVANRFSEINSVSRSKLQPEGSEEELVVFKLEHAYEQQHACAEESKFPDDTLRTKETLDELNMLFMDEKNICRRD